MVTFVVTFVPVINKFVIFHVSFHIIISYNVTTSDLQPLNVMYTKKIKNKTNDDSLAQNLIYKCPIHLVFEAPQKETQTMKKQNFNQIQNLTKTFSSFKNQ